jgi:hypothetical protein
MTKTSRQPIPRDIDELISYLPYLYADGFTPIVRWEGGSKGPHGIFTMAWPVYEDVVEEFFRQAARECWSDFYYKSAEASRLLHGEDAIKRADMNQIKTMLTYCVRGERVYAGHWSEMIEAGYIRRLLRCLVEIR